MRAPTLDPVARPTDQPLEILDGVVKTITYVNEENGYTIARLKVPRHRPLVTITGCLPGISVGEGLRVEGYWANHPRYGRQFVVVRHQHATPDTPSGLKRYLGSGLLKGVGPVLAEQIVNTFGMNTIHVLDEAPWRLAEVPGLGRRRAQSIAEAWAARRTLNELMQFLQREGLPVALAVRILRKYGSAAESVIRGQPYRLAAEVYGVPFEVADAIAARSGIAQDAPQRIGAGLAHVLREAAESGHVYLPGPELMARAARLLHLAPDLIANVLPDMEDAGFIVREQGLPGPDGVSERVYLPGLYGSEVAVANALYSLLAARRDRLPVFKNLNWEQAWRYLAARETVRLTERQQAAIQAALTRRVVVITGGPGTGKTTALRGIVRLATARGHSVVLAAPTGRAAKRLSEATGAPASTIHRLLELRPGGTYEVREPLDADLVIIDEASMMDLPLASALLRAVPPGAHLVMVGDADQLPPVGAGAVFRDIIDSGAVTVVRLDTVFRQPEGSAIVSNAHLINQGLMPRFGEGICDFFFLNERGAAECAQLVVDLACRRLPARYGFDPVEDIQVIAPVYAGVCGIDALNASMQAVLNPPHPAKDERRFGNRVFRVGDRVMQVVNDYDRQVSNGEMGRISRIDLEEQVVLVTFDSELTVPYTFQELDELTHAYAISVHKAQGSEYPAIVMPVLPQFGRLLQRNVLYTGVSRARRLVVLAGSQEALRRGVANDTSARRYSSLVERLRQFPA